MRVGATLLVLASCVIKPDPPGHAFDASVDGVDVTMCPPSYTTTIAISSSRYRITATPSGHFSASHLGCNADLAGMTHLAALDSSAEAKQIALMLPVSATRYWVGAVQLPNQPTTSSGWFRFTGEPLPDTLWSLDEPNDDINSEGDRQQFGELGPEGLHDTSRDVDNGTVCECDGRPIADSIAAAIETQ